jgi:hypothetical protein
MAIAYPWSLSTRRALIRRRGLIIEAALATPIGSPGSGNPTFCVGVTA